MRLKELGRDERKIFILHFIYSVIEGIVLGVVVLNEFVFIKSLDGSDFFLAVLFQFSMIVFVFSVFIYEIIKRYKKKNILRIVALLTRLPLLGAAFFPTELLPPDQMVIYHAALLSMFLCYYLAQPVINPIINSILKNNYSSQHFGTLYSYATSANKVVMLLATFTFGELLEADNYAFTYVYPFIAVVGIISVFLLSFAVKKEYMAGHSEQRTVMESVKASFPNLVNIIKRNKPYRDFELGFMLYGLSFMMTVAVISLFLAKELDLNYKSLAFYKNSYNLIAIVSLPFFGKLIDKIDPRKFGAFTFGTLALHLLFMALAQYLPFSIEWGAYKFYFLLLISFTFNGIFAGTMPLLWNIGSTYFCKNEDAAEYQSIHLSMVGGRAMIGPLFGIWLLDYLGYTGVFSVGIGLLIVAIYVMLRSMKVNSISI